MKQSMKSIKQSINQGDQGDQGEQGDQGCLCLFLVTEANCKCTCSSSSSKIHSSGLPGRKLGAPLGLRASRTHGWGQSQKNAWTEKTNEKDPNLDRKKKTFGPKK